MTNTIPELKGGVVGGVPQILAAGLFYLTLTPQMHEFPGFKKFFGFVGEFPDFKNFFKFFSIWSFTVDRRSYGQ